MCILWYLWVKLASANMKNESQKSSKETQGTPDDKSVSVTFHAHALPMLIVFMSLVTVNKCSWIAKYEGSHRNVGHHHIMVHWKMLCTKQLSGCGNSNGSDCSRTHSNHCSANVKSKISSVEKQKKCSWCWNHRCQQWSRSWNSTLSPENISR